MSKDLDEFDVVSALLAAVREAGSQSEWARTHGVSVQYVNDVLRGRRGPGDSILNALGFERVVSYRRMGGRKADG